MPIDEELLQAIERIVNAALDARGLEVKPSAAALRMRRMRERRNKSVTASEQKRNRRHSAERNKSVTAKPNGAETWEAYAKAYFERYGTEPVRNAKSNSLIHNFCKAVPQGEAPLIAAFFVRHNKGLYVSSHHALTLLLRDAEGLRTEWATGRKVSHAEARMADETQARGNVWGELIEEAKRRENGTH